MRLCSLNVRRGINQKIDGIVNNFKYCDFIGLQETGLLSNKNYTDITDKGNFHIFKNTDANHNGVISLMSTKLCEVKKYEMNEKFKSRLLHTSFKSDNITLHILNIYAPTTTYVNVHVQFYRDLLKYIQNLNLNVHENKILLLGDFNNIENIQDTKNINLILNRAIVDIMLEIKNTKNLVDIYRKIHPDEKIYSFTSGNQGSRIDKIYGDNYILSKVKDIKYVYYPQSDHKGLVIDILGFHKDKWGNGFWKLNESLLEDVQYVDYITNYIKHWETQKQRYSILEWWELLKKQIKNMTISYAKTIARKRKGKLSKLYKDLNLEESRVNVNENMIKDMQREITQLENQDKKGILIRSKMDFYEEDINNIDIFKLAEEKNGMKKEIKILKDSTGQVTEDKGKIMDIVKEFYTNLYSSEHLDEENMNSYLANLNLHSLGEEDRTLLSTFISEEECFKIIKSFENNKSPGIDGLGKAFYLKFWNTIGKSLTEVLNNVYLQNELSDTMKTGIISLNFKNKGDKKDLKQWRPISLLCFDYKIITKFLSGKLSKVIHKLVDIKQTGAGPGKNIFDNLFSIQDIVNYMESNDLNGYLITFDQEKAFDRVEHTFMLKVLEKMNFPDYYINWIKIIYTDIKSKVQVNGLLTENIDITRSIRQGCPLSMSLYSLVIEALACSIRNNNRIEGVHIPNLQTPVKLFQHADDCSTITVSSDDYDLFLEEFTKFGQVSGSKINSGKTEILKINNPQVSQSQENLIKENIKVLGIWFGNDSVSKNWNPIKAAIDKKVREWENRKLTFQHKILVLNTYMISKLLYVARVIPPTTEIVTGICKSIYKFFWDSNLEYLSRKSLQKLKIEGGQQIPDIETKINAMFLMRIVSILDGNKSVWTKFFIYYLGFTVREILPEFAGNMYQHNIVNIPSIYVRIRSLYLKYKGKIELNSELTCKKVYWALIEQEKYKHKVENTYPHINFDKVWVNLSNIHVQYMRDFIFRVVHNCLPSLDKMRERSVFLDSYMCGYCNTQIESLKHTFIECTQLSYFRKLVELEIRSDTSDVDFVFNNDSILFFKDISVYPYLFAFFHSVWFYRNYNNTDRNHRILLKYYEDCQKFKMRNLTL